MMREKNVHVSCESILVLRFIADVIPETPQVCRQVSSVMYSMALCLFGIPKLSAFIC